MLTVHFGGSGRTCDGVARRDFLRAGMLGLSGLTLADLLSLRAVAGAEGKSPRNIVRDRAVVLVYLSGGASHIETFDPKMGAPEGVRSLTGELKTPLPGVTFGGTFPQLAARADKLAVVRSFQHAVGDHEAAHVHMLTGGTDPQGKGDLGCSMGAMCTRLRGANHPQTGLPMYSLLTENEVDGQYANERSRVQKGSRPGTMGTAFAPFERQTVPPEASRGGTGRQRVKSRPPAAAESLELAIPHERFHDRLSLLSTLDRFQRQADATADAADKSAGLGSLDRIRHQATTVLLRGVAQAFDFRREDSRLITRYDTSSTQIGHKRFRPSTLGQQLLVARRLCEAGAGFVTVHSAGWDMHADGNNPGIVTGMELLGRTLDRAVAAFLDDVADRGLSDRVLLVITGDFGRTPKVNKRGGRDHWPRLGTLALAGGGLPMGQVIGASTRNADAAAADPVGPANLLSTILHTLFEVGQLRADASVPREIVQAINVTPIRGLVG